MTTTPAGPAGFRPVVFRHLLLHQLSFVPAGLAFVYVVTGPHLWWQSLLLLVPLLLFQIADNFSPDEIRQPPDEMPRLPFDAMLYVMFVMRLATVVLGARLISQIGFLSLDGLLMLLLVGGSGGFSIITAHELIHRREPHFRMMGRIMLGVVLYEHFYTEHVRGHHVRVGTLDDPATARFGERFGTFYKRTVPAQFRSAWRLETKRLGDVDMGLFDWRILKSRVLRGLVAEWTFTIAIFGVFGWRAFVFQLVQASMAVTALEVVNYFEHWGLKRSPGTRVQPIDSWDTTNKVTLYGLVGLSRHADHHAYASRPFQQLRHWDESPKLPRGYPGMIRLVLFNNRRFQLQMTEALNRAGLGPFREEIEPASL